MMWLIPAILAGLLWSISSVGDKYLVSNKIQNPFAYLVLMGLLGVFTVILLPFVDLSGFNLLNGCLLAVASALYFFAGIPYLKAMQIEEVTRINIWWNLIPIFSFIIGFAGGLERFSLNQLIAFVFLVAGSFTASLHSGRFKKIRFSKAVSYMIIAVIAFAVYGQLLHYVAKSVSFVTIFVIINLSHFIFALIWFLIWKKLRKDIKSNLKKHGNILLLMVFAVVIFETAGAFFNQWALSLGPASLVFSTEGFQSLFVFIIAILLSIFYPKIIKEEIDRKNILLKISALVLMMCGIVFLYLV